MHLRRSLPLLGLFALTALAAPALAQNAGSGGSSHPEALKLLNAATEKTAYPFDLKILAQLQETQKERKRVYESLIYSRDPSDGEQQFVMLISRPKTEEGNGYLLIGRNLWSYDSKVGKWERRTMRERLAGTDLVTSDVQQSQLTRHFDVNLEGSEQVGKIATQVVSLKARPGTDADYPLIKLWIDKDNIIRKRQNFAESGTLLRTLVFTKVANVKGPDNKTYVLPSEFRIFDEVEKDRSTIVQFKKFDTNKFSDTQFTKAWLEGKSR